VTAEELVGIRHPVPLDKLLMLGEDSTLEIEVKVSFDKTGCSFISLTKTIYKIEKAFDDLTTFTNNDMNGWSFGGAAGVIGNEGGEFYAMSRFVNEEQDLVMRKTYDNVKSGEPCSLSFDYLVTKASGCRVSLGIEQPYPIALPPVMFTTIGAWKDVEIKFYMGLPGTSAYSALTISSQSSAVIKIDNIRLRRLPR